MEIGVEVPQEGKNRTATPPDNTNPGYTRQRLCILYPNRYMDIHAYCCSIHNSQEVEPA